MRRSRRKNFLLSPASRKSRRPCKWKQFDLVPQEYEVRDGNADYAGRMVVIGTDLKEDELAKLFHVQ